jgi:tetratricopeptide (TPR) repeat protein
MEELAEPGSVYVTEDAYKITEGLFRFEALGEKEVKGKKKPVKVFRVIAPSTRRTRFDVSTERGLTPFVGRERGLELLLDGFKRMKGGRGQVISIVSEAGVGKSRILYEFRKAVANEDVTFLEGKCLSYSTGISYHPVIDILKSVFNIQEGEEDLTIKEKVKKGTEAMELEEVSTLPYLLELLSVKDSGIDEIMMSPEGKKERIIEALRRIVLKGSEIRPLIMAIEDLHWIDKSSEEVLKYLLESLTDKAILLILTYRPKFISTWETKLSHTQVTLNRLSSRESLIMVAHLLGTEDFNPDLENLILEKAEGVPFFIEEFVKSLTELKILEKSGTRYLFSKDIKNITIPSTIQDVIMARVDSLPAETKEILQTGSVIEREFSHELIKKVTSLPEQELQSNLSILMDSGLVYERGVYPKLSYIFKHALTQEVIYDSILKKRRKELHEKIGKAIEELYRKNIDEYYGMLSNHFIKSENYEKGAEYSKLAARKEVKIASLNDAIEYSKKATHCLERLPKTIEVEKEIVDVRTRQGLYYIQINRHLPAKEAIDPIIESAIKHQYKKRLSQLFTIMGTYYLFIEESFKDAFRYFTDALKVAEEQNDVVSSYFASYWLGCGLFINCEFDKSYTYLDRALQFSRAANNLWGITAIKSTVATFVYYFQGNLDLAYQTSNEALRIAEDSGDIHSKAMANVAHGISYYGKGLLDAAIMYLLKGVDLSQTIDLFFWNGVAQSYLGQIYYEIGEYRKSENHYQKAIRLFNENSFMPSYNFVSEMGLVMDKVMRNEKDINLNSLYPYVLKNKWKPNDGSLHRYIAEILFNISDQNLNEAEDWINKAIEADRRNGIRFHLAKDYVFYSKFFKQKGDKSKTRDYLTKALDIFKECGAEDWVRKYEKELATLL